jgi:hypothetical protein
MESCKLRQTLIINNDMKLETLLETIDDHDRLSRAKSMGYDTDTVWYHGSKTGGFTKFDKKYLGSGVVNSRPTGFFFSDDKDAARYFSDPEYIEKESDDDWNIDDVEVYGENSEYYFIVNDVNKGPYDTYEKAEAAGEKIINHHNSINVGDTVHDDDKVSAYFLALKNSLIVYDMVEFRAAEQTAEASGYDSIIGKDVMDGDMYSNIVIVFDPANIRSVNAKFTLDSKGSPGLMEFSKLN